MKKTITKKISKRLAQYGALTVAIAAVSNASGQIIYTDVDPDFGGDGLNFQLDLDNNGVIDYDIDHRPGTSTANAIRVLNSEYNAILGLNFGGNYNYPFALNYSDVISSGASTWIYHSVLQTLNWNSCSYTNSQWCGVTDKYLGLEFHIGGAVHYGWARLDVPLDPTGWLIKDYAYNATPDEPIFAGQILGIEDHSINNFRYFVDANNQLNLRAEVPLESVQLFNVAGQQVVSQKLSSTNEVVDLASFTTGVYFVTVIIDGNSKSFKIVKR
jgi:type IX secretion system substrate protein